MAREKLFNLMLRRLGKTLREGRDKYETVTKKTTRTWRDVGRLIGREGVVEKTKKGTERVER